jgi:hypothetical protein
MDAIVRGLMRIKRVFGGKSSQQQQQQVGRYRSSCDNLAVDFASSQLGAASLERPDLS